MERLGVYPMMFTCPLCQTPAAIAAEVLVEELLPGQLSVWVTHALNSCDCDEIESAVEDLWEVALDRVREGECR